jgi:hypothetical protein
MVYDGIDQCSSGRFIQVSQRFVRVAEMRKLVG